MPRRPPLEAAASWHRLAPNLKRTYARLLEAVRVHRLMAIVLLAAIMLRAAVWVAFGPALFFNDSWAYIEAANAPGPVGFRVDRPSGYPLLLASLWAAGPSLGFTTAMQHIAGVATGLLAYVFLTRLSVSRWLAALASGVVLFDAYTLALEQHIMPEAFFSVVVMGAVVLLAARPPTPSRFVAAGALLAVAVTLRSSAMFAVPVVAAYLLGTAGVRKAAIAGAGFAVPVVAYFALQFAGGHAVGFNHASGWFLYGRVAAFAECRDAPIPADARPLCQRTRSDRSEGPAFHVWDSRSAANRTFGNMGHPRSSEILRDFSLAIIRDRPWQYLGTVGSDLLRYVTPGTRSDYGSDAAISFPENGKLYLDTDSWITERRARYFPQVSEDVRAPAGPLRGYHSVARIPSLLLAVVVLISLAALITGRRRAEIFLSGGISVAIVVASTATSAFVLRYAVPLYPLFVCAGALGASEIWRFVRQRRQTSLARSTAAPYVSATADT